MAPRRILVTLPTGPPTAQRTGPKGHTVGRFWTVGSNLPGVAKPRRARRAAEGDLWRDCVAGRNCPWDIRNKYTQNTPADNILKYGSAGVFFGGLGIGVGAGTALREGATAAEAAGIGDRVTVPIPRERPYRLPGSDLPVHVDNSAPVTPRPPAGSGETPANTFVNPAFEDSFTSSENESVIIGGPVPYNPVERGEIFYPAREGVGQIAVDDIPTRRGDALDVVEISGSRPAFPGTARAPPLSGPFEEVELVTLGGRAQTSDPTGEYDTWLGPDTGYDQWIGSVEEIPARASTPGPGGTSSSTQVFDNPAFDPAHIDHLFRQGLRDYGIDPSEVQDVGPSILTGRDSTVSVSRSVSARGMSLRSGYVLPRLMHLVGELSGISPLEPPIELSTFSSPFREVSYLDTGFHGTQPWDGAGGIDTGDIEFGEGDFEDIPLDDPFPEMEVMEEDDAGSVTIGGLQSAQQFPIHIQLQRGRQVTSTAVQTSYVTRPVGPPEPVPLPPFPGGVIIDINVDPSLYWRWWRRRRRGYGFFFR
ncbi:L2 [Serinus canaria papillomavirus 1]|uniref:L2 n=1 Tax=Serinus canaria papillomavirus 1 TaxID=2094713 RepID=UPI000D0C41E1|nr:L2 [Serinus canaria papillomavirus 1]AVH76294.1 L2 [Serinus canaria papillomavirus 1]